MDIQMISKEDQMTLLLSGRLDTTTAPMLEGRINEVLADGKEMILDFEALEYISSAGLRVLLTTQKKVNKMAGSSLRLLHVSADIREILDITGFSDILTIE